MTNSRSPRPTGSPMVTVTVDGEPAEAYPGETVATVMLAIGRQTFRHTDHLTTPRGRSATWESVWIAW